jgi:hypothetical protein
LDQTATLTLIVVAIRCTDHRLSLIGTKVKQLGLAPAQAVQKPAGLSFHVPDVAGPSAALAPAELAPAALVPAALVLAALAPAALADVALVLAGFAPAAFAPAALAPAAFAAAALVLAALALAALVAAALAAAAFRGSRKALPSGVKVILNLAPVGEDAVNGWPLKNVALMSLGFIASAAIATVGARTKDKSAVRNSIVPPGESDLGSLAQLAMTSKFTPRDPALRSSRWQKQDLSRKQTLGTQWPISPPWPLSRSVPPPRAHAQEKRRGCSEAR